ncbi:hypothetical protein O6H91_23G015700 [Diphasiastrum complanatum]|uniref:Uncharacterized protein n=1 Tax=Diphasiastrum complanatum TaxID=34168 RepID=A0ACC2A8D0_DIPCM|nr:hypothetical protein O6H91_23G015700 [Diphasiastrum complanatum]
MASVTAPLSPEASISEWKKMKVQELREVLASKGLETDGVKSSLIERLENSAKSDTAKSDIARSDETSPILEGSTEPLKEKEVENECEISQKVNNGHDMPKPVEELVSGDSPESLPAEEQLIVTETNGASKEIEEKTILITADVPSPQNINGTQDCAAPPSDLEKKQRRAERFGVDVKMSENEKRRLRAARFGAASDNLEKGCQSVYADSSKMSPTLKEAEAEKRKARAARFGTSESSEKSPSDDDAKKRARLARFGSSPDARTDPSSEEKKKARAARFGSAAKEVVLNGENKFQGE